MEITYDPSKDAINRKKHGISLVRTLDLHFETAYIKVDDREDYGEIRYQAVGFLDARMFVLIFSMEGLVVRPISLRKATKAEEREYAEEY